LNRPIEGDRAFIKRLEILVTSKDRGALAALRCGRGKPPGSVRGMDQYVIPFLPAEIKQNKEDIYYLVAALFAYWHQGQEEAISGEGNIGSSLRLMVEQEAQKGVDARENASKRLDKRLTALLDSHSDDLPNHLGQIVSLLKSAAIPINWLQLLHDLKGWEWESRDVQRNWAREFWARRQRSIQSEETDTNESSTIIEV